VRKVALALIFFLFASQVTASATLYIHTDNLYFHVENEQYNVSHTMPFSRIIVSNGYIQFNTTRFKITAPNFIYITLHFINASITGANESDLLINFTADTSGGNVYFNLSGFVPQSNYTIQREYVNYTTVQANSSGWISWNNSLWDTPKNFGVYVAFLVEGLPSYLLYVIATLSNKNIYLWLYILLGCLLIIPFYRKKRDKILNSL